MDFKKYFYTKNPLFYKLAFYIMLVTVTLIGFFKGVLAETGGKDAQWYPSKLLSENIDLYNFYLENYNDWVMRSVPNYYFQMYYLLQPIASTSWNSFKLIWFLANLILLLLFLFMVKKDFKFNYQKMCVVFLPFFIGFPLISVFTNGQSTILIVMLAYLAWKYKENPILLPILLSFLTLKYSFGFPILLGFLLMGYYRSVIIGGLITLLFPLMYSIQFELNFLSTIFLPFKVSTSPIANSIGGGPANLMSLYQQFFDGPLLAVNVLTIVLVLFIILFSFVSLKYRLDKKTIFICALLFSLFGFYHNGHDYVLFLLILPFIIKLRHFKFIYSYLLLFCFMPRIVRLLDIVLQSDISVKEFMYDKYFVIFNVSILISYFFLLIKNDLDSKRRAIYEHNIEENKVLNHSGKNKFIT